MPDKFCLVWKALYDTESHKWDMPGTGPGQGCQLSDWAWPRVQISPLSVKTVIAVLPCGGACVWWGVPTHCCVGPVPVGLPMPLPLPLGLKGRMCTVFSNNLNDFFFF